MTFTAEDFAEHLAQWSEDEELSELFDAYYEPHLSASLRDPGNWRRNPPLLFSLHELGLYADALRGGYYALEELCLDGETSCGKVLNAAYFADDTHQVLVREYSWTDDDDDTTSLYVVSNETDTAVVAVIYQVD